MAEVFREKVSQLAAALDRGTEKDAARQALRGLVERIVIPPGDESWGDVDRSQQSQDRGCGR